MNRATDIVLALDASGKTAGACVLRGGEAMFEQTLDEGLTHSETLLPLAARAFMETGLGPGDVGLYAVTGGPGSFTGLRIGMALVKGLALPHGAPAAAVSTLEALALAETLRRPGMRGIVVPALNARRGEVYWAAFDNRGETLLRLAPDAAGPAADIGEALGFERAQGTVSGLPVFFVGDGDKICYNSYNYVPPAPFSPAKGPPPIALGAALLARRAWLCAGGAGFGAGALRPAYLRLSQAERERKARQNITQ